MTQLIASDILVAGGGLAGLITALEALRAGKTVTVVDRDTPDRLGGLALWAFGGMALVGTPLQASMKIPDTPERALADWLRFGEIAPDDTYPQQWARYYVEHSRSQVYDWLIGEGVKFKMMLSLTAAHRPLPVVVSVSVTLPFAISAAVGV